MFYFLPIKNFINIEPIFLLSPFLVVGIPVYLAIFCFADEIPSALFQEKLNPNFLPIGVSLLINLVTSNFTTLRSPT